MVSILDSFRRVSTKTDQAQAHALAGAVVDVFTCDSFADGVMSTFRTSRGMERQISVRGGRDRAAFVAELRRQCALPFGGVERPRPPSPDA
jgi:hypothetical protein